MSIKQIVKRVGLHGLDRRIKKALKIHKYQMSFPPYGEEVHKRVLEEIDVVRYGAFALAIHRIQTDNIPGDFAELGVFKGELSTFISSLKTGRSLHLFDTFAGFPEAAMDSPEEVDSRFTDTSLEAVKKRIGDCTDVVFHQGSFPGTSAPVMDKTFSFVVLDMDKYNPILEGLKIFYPRMSKGGYIFIHDFNSPESDYGVSKAVYEFFDDKVEQIIELPDRGGSVLIRKV